MNKKNPTVKKQSDFLFFLKNKVKLPAAIKLGKKYNIDLPIINAVNNVVNGIVSPRVAVNSLFNREPKPEV